MLKSFFLNKKWVLWSWGGLIVLISSLYFQVLMTVAINTWYGKFYDLLQNLNPSLPPKMTVNKYLFKNR